ncbi:hypothetical protein [Candidatus Hakubella thermalkaliphila]|nr:hypothetical protein [Candidatus Hakubella thermalkaliphila]
MRKPILSEKQIIDTIRKSSWPDAPYERKEYNKHRGDWVRQTGIVLSPQQFMELQSYLLDTPKKVIYFYVHKNRENIGIYADSVQALGKIFRNIGLIYEIEHGVRTGFWRIKRGRRYFEEHLNVVIIKE